MRDGSGGIHGNRGNVASVSCRFTRTSQSSNPTLSANLSFSRINNLTGSGFSAGNGV